MLADCGNPRQKPNVHLGLLRLGRRKSAREARKRSRRARAQGKAMHNALETSFLGYSSYLVASYLSKEEKKERGRNSGDKILLEGRGVTGVANKMIF